MQFRFVLEELRQFAEERFHELLGRHESAVRVPEGRDHHGWNGAGFAVAVDYSHERLSVRASPLI
jgi:hypothetical protein